MVFKLPPHVTYCCIADVLMGMVCIGAATDILQHNQPMTRCWQLQGR